MKSIKLWNTIHLFFFTRRIGLGLGFNIPANKNYIKCDSIPEEHDHFCSRDITFHLLFWEVNMWIEEE